MNNSLTEKDRRILAAMLGEKLAAKVILAVEELAQRSREQLGLTGPASLADAERLLAWWKIPEEYLKVGREVLRQKMPADEPDALCVALLVGVWLAGYARGLAENPEDRFTVTGRLGLLFAETFVGAEE